MDIKVGDIIDGKRVTKVYELCGGTAYNTEPIKETVNVVNAIEDIQPVKKRGGRRKKEQ